MRFILSNFPQEFASDNGPEFKNAKFEEFCIKKISFVHGIPYNPHSKGKIERFNYTIKKYLCKEFISHGYKPITVKYGVVSRISSSVTLKN